MPKLCTIDGCSKPLYATGMCTMHYCRMRRSGTLDARATASAGEGIAWLKDRARHSGDDCLAWPFGSPKNGYGQVRVNGVDMAASRYMCLLVHGEPASADYEAAHSCGNGHHGCCNPRHLSWKTHSENMVGHDASPAVNGQALFVRCAVDPLDGRLRRSGCRSVRR